MQNKILAIILDLSPIYHSAIIEIEEITSGRGPRVKLHIDSNLTNTKNIFVQWVASILHGTFRIQSSQMFPEDNIIFNNLSPSLGQELNKLLYDGLILNSAIPAEGFPEAIELKFIGRGIIAAVRSV